MSPVLLAHRTTSWCAAYVLASLALCACASTSASSSTGDVPRAAVSQVTAKGDSDVIHVESPAANELVHSPLRIRGKARGMWYFEADFPVTLLDQAGTVLARAPARVLGEWMTENYVPFELDLTFDAATATRGILVMEKANASGLPEHADELRIPVRFASIATQQSR